MPSSQTAGSDREKVRTFTIFYSWQSDRNRQCCKDFIRIAADAAAKRVGEQLGIRVLVDADTEGVAGTPPISDTILGKIAACDLFLADMTFVAQTEAGKRLPNPNVMGEYGYALRARGLGRILLVMNAAFGPPDQLPFDLHHLRHPEEFTLAEGAPDGERRLERSRFSKKLERNISAAISHALASESPPSQTPKWEAGETELESLVNSRLTGVPVLVKPPKLSVWIVPLAALEARALTAQAVKATRPYFTLIEDGSRYDGQDERQWWSGGRPLAMNGRLSVARAWSVRLVRPGLLEAVANIGEQINDDPYIVVRGLDLERMLVGAVDRLAELANELGLRGPAVISAVLEGVENVQITRPGPGSGGRQIGKPFVWLGTVHLPNLTIPTADHLQEMIEKIWLIGGWGDGSPAIVDGRWTG